MTHLKEVTEKGKDCRQVCPVSDFLTPPPLSLDDSLILNCLSTFRLGGTLGDVGIGSRVAIQQEPECGSYLPAGRTLDSEKWDVGGSWANKLTLCCGLPRVLHVDRHAGCSPADGKCCHVSCSSVSYISLPSFTFFLTSLSGLCTFHTNIRNWNLTSGSTF